MRVRSASVGFACLKIDKVRFEASNDMMLLRAKRAGAASQSRASSHYVSSELQLLIETRDHH